MRRFDKGGARIGRPLRRDEREREREREKGEIMRVIGYTFEADQHCVGCTIKRHAEKPFELGDPLGRGEGSDENGLPYAAEDNEGNAVHPIFSTDEVENYCGDCGGELYGS